MKKNKHKNQNSNNSKLKSFTLFLLLATIFWVLTKFSKEYTTTIQTNIEYTNTPASYTLLPNTPTTLDLEVSGNGFSFLFFKIKKPTITISLAESIKKKSLKITIPKNKLKQIIASQLDKNITIKNLYSNALEIYLDTYSTKKIPVKLVTNISFENGYFLINDVKSKPDSVQVSGPSRWIDTLKYVTTQPIKKEHLKNSVSEMVSLKLEKNIQATPNKVNITIEVAEFTQKQMQLPIELINIPDDAKISLIPQQVTISFNISIEDFKKVTPNDFKLVCDFSKRDEDSHTIPVKIIKSPSKIIQLKIDPSIVEYLVFK